jgi:probable phosphoglycerate mutase
VVSQLKLYLLRHGETEYSRTGGYCGALDPELTPEGARMAREFAAAYHSLPWAAVYASPMRRTVATARPLCDAVGVPMQTRDGLREIAYGAWEGLTQEAVKERYAEEYVHWMTEPAWNAPSGGETAQQIASRATPVVSEILAAHVEGGGNVLVVSHKATLRILLCGFLGIDLGRYRDRLAMPAGAVSVVRVEKYGPLLESLGDRSYLSDDLRQREGT